jgi:hypothetical protein
MTNETTPTVASPTKRNRRVVAKATQAPPKIKTAVNLSPEAFKRLGVHCAMESRTQSDLIEELIMSGLRRYRVQTLDRAGDVESACPVGSAA